jgi:hypothetical protein
MLGVFGSRVLRRLHGLILKTANGGRDIIKELHKILQESNVNITGFKWVGHVIRMKERTLRHAL